MGGIAERFHQYTDLGREIDKQLCRLEEMEASVGNTGAGSFGSIGRAAGTHADRTGRLAAALATLKEEIRDLIAEETSERRELEKLLNARTDAGRLLTADEKAVLRVRYFDALPWEQAAEVLAMSDRGARNIHNRAMEKLETAFRRGGDRQ